MYMSANDGSGFEYQVADDAGDTGAMTDPRQRSGAMYQQHAPRTASTRPAGEWNQSRIVVHGRKVEHWLNSEKVVEVELPFEVPESPMLLQTTRLTPGSGTSVCAASTKPHAQQHEAVRRDCAMVFTRQFAAQLRSRPQINGRRLDGRAALCLSTRTAPCTPSSRVAIPHDPLSRSFRLLWSAVRRDRAESRLRPALRTGRKGSIGSLSRRPRPSARFR